MLKPGPNRPNTPNNSKPTEASQDTAPHWRQGVRETVLSTCTDGSLNFSIEGGSDNGEFAYIGEVVQNKVNYASGHLQSGNIILEIQGQKVAGYTQRDVVAWLHHCCKNGNPVVLKTVSPGSITKDLRQFLNTRFQKGSVDHELQNTIRDNLYLRTVPVTTRLPRDGEVNGVDYTFLNPDEFLALEHSGNLLESGIYEGNHYGTPKPSKEPPPGPAQSPNSVGNLGLLIGGLFPGAHPSSEGKRKRNRSNVEAMAAKSMEPELSTGGGESLLGSEANLSSNASEPIPAPSSPPSYAHASECPDSPRADLGPLPSNWEKAYTERGEVYFIDHNSGTSHWLDPRLSKFQKKSLEECMDDELPYGWEKIEDPHYGTYYIDHVNRKTQYENPVIQAKRAAQGSGAALVLNESEPSYLPAFRKPQNLSASRSNCSNIMTASKHSKSHERPFFTRNPNELQGERIQTSLVKSSRGLGFTIIGGDDSEEEFLQIKSVVPHAPAWLDGKMQTGDTLVYVNNTCVLGFTHHDMVSMFQSIAPGDNVTLELCRGYPLPFDPNDPNTEVVTTVAVNAPDDSNSNVYMDRDGNLKSESFNLDMSHGHNGSEDMVGSSVKSMPHLCSSNMEKVKNLQRPSSTDILLNDSSDILDFNESSLSKPEFLSISIVKGAMGFGFTIADSAYGQKVKKILDRQRCKNLMEGDILVDINNINVRNMCHSEVVQVLKDCPRNQEASVTVQRGGLGSPSKNKLRRKEEPASPRKNNTYKDPLLGLYRSKTPTADLYSTQQKEVIPNRPKTPLVDTRNRPKTPTSTANNASQNTWTSDSKSNILDNNIGEGAAPQSPSSPMYDPYKDNFTYGYSSRQEASIVQINNQLMATSLADGPRVDLEQSRSPAQELDYPDNMTHTYQQGGTDNRSPSGDYFGQYMSQNYYNGYGSPYDNSYSYKETLSKDCSFLQATGLPCGPMPSSNYGYDSQGRRKEGTSFEHEQPHPSVVTRLNRDPRWYAMGPTVRVYSAGPGMEWVETVAALIRQESGFGFRIVGGTEEGSQVSIGHIVPGGAADLDGRLCTGDEIVSVDSQNVLSTSHHHVVQLMGKAANNGRVTLGIRRRVPTHELHNYTRPEMGYPFDVTVARRESEGFGFVIISSVNKAGSTIGRIIEGSPAERCGQLHVGDRILAVNHMDIVNLHHGDIVNLIKDSGYTVTLTIGPPIDDSSSTASVSQREEDCLEEYHAVELSRGKRGFGFSIRGGQEFQNMPLFVLQIAENGPASVDNRLRVSDQIIEINGVNTKNMTHAEAIEIIRNGGPCVRLLVKRGGKIPASIADSGGAAVRPSSSLSQPSSALTTTASTLNGVMCWDRFPPS